MAYRMTRVKGEAYMYKEVMAAYLLEDSIMKVSAQSGLKMGVDDFSITLLFSADSSGVLISCLDEPVGSNPCKGWYLAVREDATIVFQVSDGKKVCSAVSSIIPDCFDGYFFHLVAVRSGEKLRLYLEGDLIGESIAGSSARLDVSCGEDLIFGGNPKGLNEEKYNGLLQCVTLWSRALPESLFDFTASDVLPTDRTGLQGWWSLDGGLMDRGPNGYRITYCENVLYYPVFDLMEAENESGYCYGNVMQSAPATIPSVHIKRLLNEASSEKLSRRITVTIDKPGVFFGSCSACGPVLTYPKGVTMKVVSPSNKNLVNMVTTDKQLIVLEAGQVYQFLFLEPEQGDWTLELTAEIERDFVLDYQFIPNGTTREELTQTMNGLYPQYFDSTLADNTSPTQFLFSTLAKILTHDINQQLAAHKDANKNNRKELTVDPITVGAVVILVGMAATACFVCYCLYKGIKGLYHWIASSTPETPPEETYQYDWQTIENEMHGYYTFSESTLRLYTDIQTKLKGRVPQNPESFYTRKDLNKLGSDMRLHLDIGGEGCFWDGNLLSGFAGAINLNVTKTNSQGKKLRIPYLIHLNNWNMKWPFESGSVDRITSQGTPAYNDVELEEAARCIRKVKGSRIDIWTNCDYWRDFRLDKLADKIRKLAVGTDVKVRLIEKAPDPEFKENYVEDFAKYSVELY